MGSDDDQSDEMALNLTKAATDQGQGGLEEKTRSNSTTQLTVDLVKDDPRDDPMELFQTVWHALIPPKSGHKQPPPSKIAEDGALPLQAIRTLGQVKRFENHCLRSQSTSTTTRS
ncbi:unnamed protein product [Cylindrotheca closterium]|uniref:Uncharacterized protein n=1 Tax=Cylindrotheca closterium TaxID=2856 RepID=A0AAD2JNC6_9STRA|nr:unnamed protein product [Cylindrotheca closterium]